MHPGSGVSSRWLPWKIKCFMWCDDVKFSSSIESILLLRNFSVPTWDRPSNELAHMMPRSDSWSDNTATLVRPRNVNGDSSVKSMKANFSKPTLSMEKNASGSISRMPDGKIKCSTCVRPENADVSIFNIGLFDSKISLTFDVPANAFVSTRKILLWLNRMVVIFWRPANANWATVANGVCCIDISRIFGNPRNANGLIVVILLPSNDNFLRLRSPANASLFMIGKLFFVSDKFSTLAGKRFVGISRRPPVLHRTCKWNGRIQKIYVSKEIFCAVQKRWMNV